MSKMVKQFVNNCDLCRKNKFVKHIKQSLEITGISSKSFEVISADTVGPLRPSDQYTYILTTQYDLTKHIIAHHLKKVKSIAKILVQEVILKHGLFKKFTSDNGTEFNKKLIKKICKSLHIK